MQARPKNLSNWSKGHGKHRIESAKSVASWQMRSLTGTARNNFPFSLSNLLAHSSVTWLCLRIKLETLSIEGISRNRKKSKHLPGLERSWANSHLPKLFLPSLSQFKFTFALRNLHEFQLSRKLTSLNPKFFWLPVLLRPASSPWPTPSTPTSPGS